MDTYGKYQIIRKIGVGGFGEVFKGFDPVIKRHLAIKTCSAGDEGMRQRFFREAEIAGNLHHRNITTVYDFGVEEGVPYLVQEFLTGEDLDTLIERAEPIAVEQKVLYLLQIARGLEYSHEKGVIHRDMKPANVRILEDGTAKVMDYGIAKLKHQESGLTRTGTTLGTTAYLAPEQVRGTDLDERADIFSFGALAYELITYQRPFKGETFSSIMYQILKEDPKPILDCSSDCPPGLAALIEKCMRKEPGDRFQSFTELLAALDRLREASAGGEAAAQEAGSDGELANRAIDLASGRAVLRPAKPDRRLPRRLVYALLLIAAAALGVTVWWLVGQPSEVAATNGGGPLLTPPSAASASNVDGGGGDPAASLDPNDGGGAELSGAEPPPIDAPPPPEPPPPPASLRVARAWSGQMTVALDGGTPRPLNRERSWELPPGRHLLVFDLDSLDYRATETLEVDLSPGQSRRIETPIEEPARITVQAHVGSAQAEVRVDGDDIGRTPIRRHAVAPGEHRLQVLPPPDANLAEIAREITVRAGQELIVTFDLAGERELLLLEREAQEP